MKTAFVLISGLLFPFFIFAQLQPLPDKTSETWYDKVPVSGEIRVGLMIDNSCTEKVRNSFYVKLPNKKEYDYLSVEISSNDGRYTYKSHYNITNEVGVIEVSKVSKLSNKLEDYTCNDLSIMSWVSNDITTKKDKFVLSNWNDVFTSSHVHIYLNSENPAIIYVERKNSSQTKKIACNEIKDRANVAYNCLCIIPAEDLENSNISIVQRVRRSQTRYPLSIIK